jgi:hypothetical protein
MAEMTRDEIIAVLKRIEAKIAEHGLPARPLSDDDRERAERLKMKTVDNWELYFHRGRYGLLPRPMLVAHGKVRHLSYWQAICWKLGLLK